MIFDGVHHGRGPQRTKASSQIAWKINCGPTGDRRSNLFRRANPLAVRTEQIRFFFGQLLGTNNLFFHPVAIDKLEIVLCSAQPYLTHNAQHGRDPDTTCDQNNACLSAVADRQIPVWGIQIDRGLRSDLPETACEIPKLLYHE